MFIHHIFNNAEVWPFTEKKLHKGDYKSYVSIKNDKLSYYISIKNQLNKEILLANDDDGLNIYSKQLLRCPLCKEVNLIPSNIHYFTCVDNTCRKIINLRDKDILLEIFESNDCQLNNSDCSDCEYPDSDTEPELSDNPKVQTTYKLIDLIITNPISLLNHRIQAEGDKSSRYVIHDDSH